MLGALLGSLAMALGVGGAHWDAAGVPDPCAGSIAVLFMTGAEFDRVRSDATPVAVADASRCRIRVAWDRVGNRTDLCSVIVHELGHTRGLGHSLDRTNVMAASDASVPIACMEALAPRRLRNLRSQGWKCRANTSQAYWRCRKSRTRTTYVSTI